MHGNERNNRLFVSRLQDHFMQYEDVHDLKSIGRPRTILYNRKIEVIFANFDAQLELSYWERNAESGVHRSSLQRLTASYGWNFYKY
ncbi:MAG: hypothetical protein EZS28_023579 [Streblomastix strix]|uniref:Uncharacterized protein n=1 Tax=Streblomastix strix TaxID=222440 RepID=A0A5J4VEM8_9EUKA|nr:MAG: hypothetical protein EZS28_023579 [Streblomastix strix]